MKLVFHGVITKAWIHTVWSLSLSISHSAAWSECVCLSEPAGDDAHPFYMKVAQWSTDVTSA